MKEIIAIIRRHKVPETKDAFRDAGFPGLTIQSVEGRGRQRGIGGWIYEIDPGFNQYAAEKYYADPGMKFIPKRMLTIIADDNDVQKIVDIIIEKNQTDHVGDGKIFVCPIENVYRVRTGAEGPEILHKP